MNDHHDPARTIGPNPLDITFRARKTQHGRAPRDVRGNRDARLRGRILTSLHGGKQLTKGA